MGDKKGKKHLAKENRQAKARQVKLEQQAHDRQPHKVVESSMLGASTNMRRGQK